MSRRVMWQLLVLGASAALSCDRATGPALRGTDAEGPPARLDVVDAVHLGGNPHFFFLPPLVAQPTPAGAFDATLLGSLAVDVCVLSSNGCAGPPIKHFGSSSGTAPERISLNAPDHFYQVSWNTGEAIVDPRRNYRVLVLSGSTVLGRIDVDVVPNADALATVDRKEFAAVVKGDWLQIRFRVEQGAVSGTPSIVLPVSVNVPLGHDVALLVQLPGPAPAGGVVVTLASSDPARVSLSAPAVSIPSGASSGSGMLHGAAPGPATITASAAGYGPGSSAARTTASLRIPVRSMTLPPGPVSVYTSLPIQLQSLGAPVAAPPGGITIKVSASDLACVARGTPQFIPAGQTSTAAPIRWAASGSPLPCTAYVKVSAPDVTPDSIPVTVTAAQLLRFSNPSVVVGSGLESGGAAIQLATPAPPGGVVVHVVSDDSTLLLLAPAFDYSTPGTGTLDVPVAAGGSLAFYNVQGLEARTGMTRVRATAPGYASDSVDATVQRAAFQIVALPASMKVGGSAPFRVVIGIEALSANGPVVAALNIRGGGTPVTVTIANSNGAVAELVTFGPVATQVAAMQIGTGLPSTASGGAAAHGIELRALAPGSTTVSASIPGVFPFQGGTQTVTITP